MKTNMEKIQVEERNTELQKADSVSWIGADGTAKGSSWMEVWGDVGANYDKDLGVYNQANAALLETLGTKMIETAKIVGLDLTPLFGKKVEVK